MCVRCDRILLAERPQLTPRIGEKRPSSKATEVGRRGLGRASSDSVSVRLAAESSLFVWNAYRCLLPKLDSDQLDESRCTRGALPMIRMNECAARRSAKNATKSEIQESVCCNFALRI